VYCKGLLFLSVDGTHFAQIIKLAKLAPSAYYAPPTRKVLANKLLDLSYENRMEKFMSRLEMDADVYGLSLFGDGATVHGMPLMNILAWGVHEPSAVLAIIDCKFANQFVCFLLLSNSLYIIFSVLLYCFLYLPRDKMASWKGKKGCSLHCLFIWPMGPEAWSSQLSSRLCIFWWSKQGSISWPVIGSEIPSYPRSDLRRPSGITFLFRCL
jgi:hypothetical protein